jgi:hypothetical protein
MDREPQGSPPICLCQPARFALQFLVARCSGREHEVRDWRLESLRLSNLLTKFRQSDSRLQAPLALNADPLALAPALPAIDVNPVLPLSLPAVHLSVGIAQNTSEEYSHSSLEVLPGRWLADAVRAHLGTVLDEKGCDDCVSACNYSTPIDTTTIGPKLPSVNLRSRT